MYEVNLTVGVRKSKRGWRVLLARIVRHSSATRDGEIPIRIKLKIPDEVIDGSRVEIEVPVSVGCVEGIAR